MNNSSYNIRNYQAEDFHDLVRMNRAAEKEAPAGRCISPQALTEYLNRPGCDPQRDLFVVETADSLAGFLDLTPELEIRRAILDCWIQSEHRRRGLGRELLSRTMRRAAELGLTVVQTHVVEENTAARSTLSRLGFQYVHRFLEMRLDMAVINWQDVDRAPLSCRYLRRGEEDKLALLQNRCFAGSWGYNPNTAATITNRLNLSHTSPQDVVLTCDGDNAVGYCWTETKDAKEKSGRISMIGTEPDYRGRGLGKRVLLAGLTYLKNKGVTVVDLTVDSENTVAYNLYRSIGFSVVSSTLWYEKAISQDTEAR